MKSGGGLEVRKGRERACKNIFNEPLQPILGVMSRWEVKMSTFQLAGNFPPFIARRNRAIWDWEPVLTACSLRTGSRRGWEKKKKKQQQQQQQQKHSANKVSGRACNWRIRRAKRSGRWYVRDRREPVRRLDCVFSIARLKWGWRAYLNPTARDICRFAVLFPRPFFDSLVFMKSTLCCVIRRLLLWDLCPCLSFKDWVN